MTTQNAPQNASQNVPQNAPQDAHATLIEPSLSGLTAQDVSINKKDASKTEHRFHVHVPADALTHILDQRLKRHAQTITLKGFRPGKVPLDVVKKRYAQPLYQELVNQVRQDVVHAITQHHALSPITSPQIKDAHIPSPDKPLDMDITLWSAHIPNIRYQDIVVERYNPAPPTPKDIHNALTSLKEHHPQYDDAPKQHTAQQGDRITINATITTQAQGKTSPQQGTWQIDLVDTQEQHAQHNAEQTPSSPIPLWRQQIIRTLLGTHVDDPFELTTQAPLPPPSPSDKTPQEQQSLHIKGKVVAIQCPRPCRDDDLIQLFQAQDRKDLDGKIHALLTHKGDETRHTLLAHTLHQTLHRHISVELPDPYIQDATKECSSIEQKQHVTQALRLSALYQYLAHKHALYASKDDVDKHTQAIMKNQQEPLNDEEKQRLVYRLSLSITEHNVDTFILEKIRIRDISLPFQKLMAIPYQEQASQASQASQPPHATQAQQATHDDTPITRPPPSLITST